MPPRVVRPAPRCESLPPGSDRRLLPGAGRRRVERVGMI